VNAPGFVVGGGWFWALVPIELRGVDDVVRALPPLPAQPFSTRELASLLGCSMLLAQRTAYCLRAINITEAAGKRGRTPRTGGFLRRRDRDHLTGPHRQRHIIERELVPELLSDLGHRQRLSIVHVAHA
jgi:hypothetical protein